MTVAELRSKNRQEQIGTQLLPKKKKKQRGPFVSLGEQLLAVRRADIPGSHSIRIDPRLLETERRAAAGSSEAIPADGGFLLQPEFSRRILKRMYNVGEILARCTEMPITAPNANAIRFPQFDESSRANGSRLGGVSVYFENEADALIASKPRVQLTELSAVKITGLLYATDELVQDSDALDSWARYAFSQELTFRLEDKIINGSGAGEPQGILNSPALITIEGEGGQASGTVIASNIEKMLGAFWAASYNSDGACWLYNQALLPQLASLTTVVGSGGSESKLWQWAADQDSYDMLAGIPAIMSEYCPVPGTPGDLILCDFSRYVIAMREELRAEVSIHVRFLSMELAFKFVMRVNGQTIDRSPVTPLHGTQPTSSFVALSAR